MSKFCPHCGTARAVGAAFCGGCGVHFRDQPEHCPTCGQTLPPGTQLNGSPGATGVGPATAMRPNTPALPAIVSSPAGLVYGPQFNESTDCWNCGNADVSIGMTCPLCKFVRV